MNFNDWFIYDETSPTGIRWKVDRWGGEDYRCRRVSAGDVAGSLSKKGYWQVILLKRGYRVHRVIWQMKNGEIPASLHIDHVNRKKSDNRISNLRLVLNEVNKRNSGMYSNNKSGVTGVRQITMGGRQYWCATWANLPPEKKGAAYFSTAKFGFYEAFQMACERRLLEISKLQKLGAGYSETHGL